MATDKKQRALQAELLHGDWPRVENMPLAPPLYQTSAFTFDATEDLEQYYTEPDGRWLYTRYANPTVRALEERLALADNAGDALFVASGMAAVQAAVAGLFKPGDVLWHLPGIYGGTAHLFTGLLSRWGLRCEARSAAAMAEGFACGARPAAIYLEGPTNPTLDMPDLPALAAAAHGAGARVLYDATFASPVNLRPLEHGADVVIHSTTKFINGHSDCSGGAVCASAEVLRPVRKAAVQAGLNADPFAAWLTLRGMLTLPVRMARHNDNARRVAEHLHARGVAVRHPGLPGDPAHALAARLMDGFGAVVSFRAADDLAGARAIADRLKWFRIAPTLGGIESQVSVPLMSSHRGMSAERLAEAGIHPGLLRLSVGIEEPEVLLADLDQALG